MENADLPAQKERYLVPQKLSKPGLDGLVCLAHVRPARWAAGDLVDVVPAGEMWTETVISGRDSNTGADQQLHTFCKQKDQLRSGLEANEDPVRQARPKASRLGQHQT